MVVILLHKLCHTSSMNSVCCCTPRYPRKWRELIQRPIAMRISSNARPRDSEDSTLSPTISAFTALISAGRDMHIQQRPQCVCYIYFMGRILIPDCAALDKLEHSHHSMPYTHALSHLLCPCPDSFQETATTQCPSYLEELSTRIQGLFQGSVFVANRAQKNFRGK
jgi:hypothetical protein